MDGSEVPCPLSTLKWLLDAVGITDADVSSVSFIGADPVVSTRYRVGTLGSALIAAVGLAAAQIWKMRGGKSQRLKISIYAAVAALNSIKYMHLNGGPPPPIWDPISGFYPAKHGRWIHLHCSFPTLRERILQILSAPADKIEIAKRTRMWDAAELEEAIFVGGACAGFARTPEEWSAHPQAKAVAGLPIIEIRRIGDAPVQSFTEGSRPLSGVRVLDLTRVLAGPTGSRALAEHGAEVLKITSPHLVDSGLMELDTGLGKFSAHLDLRQSDHASKLRELAQATDIFCQSYRPGALANYGFGPEAIASIRPGIIYATLSAWGHGGPWGHRRGYDSVVQSATGMAYVSRVAERPQFLPVAAIDYLSGYSMALGVMAALMRRAVEGGSWLVRVSLAKTGQWISENGLFPGAQIAELGSDVPAQLVEEMSVQTNGPAGVLKHLSPAVKMSETPPYWARSAVPLGFDPPEWPAGSRDGQRNLATHPS
jgi:crotonobetainyl-CoA:carnitine CoA-transferase CaiB-like acyl-CoA transferase